MTKSKPYDRRLVWALLGLALVSALAWSPWLDRRAEGHFEKALTRALITFGLARALNGVISVVQGTEIAVQPAGVGATFTPGEILDPLNDLVERFSWVMLAASTSLGIQKILMDISVWWGLRLLVMVAALAAVLAFRWGSGKQRRLSERFLVMALFLRFAMPVMVLLNDAVYELFMAQQYAHAASEIQSTSEDLVKFNAAQEEAMQAERSWMDGLGRWLGEAADSLNIKRRLELFHERMAGAIEQLLRLTAVFVLQTIILPLLFLWGLARTLGTLQLWRRARPRSTA